MKKIITCGIAATLCAAVLSIQAFAADITEDMSVFADNAEELAATVVPRRPNGVLDPKTIMPAYSADIRDYVSTGELIISKSENDGRQQYLGDMVDKVSGEFIAAAYFFDPTEADKDVGTYYPEYSSKGSKQCSPSYFHLYSEEIKSILLANGISPDVKEVKFLFLEGVGTVYYINNGTEEVLVNARGIPSAPWDGYFDDVDGIIVLNEEFRQRAAAIEAEKRRNYEKFKEENGEDAKGAGGADNNPNTGSESNKQVAALAIGLAALSVSAVGVKAVSRKRKNDR